MRWKPGFHQGPPPFFSQPFSLLTAPSAAGWMTVRARHHHQRHLMRLGCAGGGCALLLLLLPRLLLLLLPPLL